jgi:NAD dependent epimerase/dehydratase family enzyme
MALRLVLGREMADELLLSSQRVEPRRLLETGYAFRFPDLEPALRHVLAG